jgi:hypothetical protein
LWVSTLGGPLQPVMLEGVDEFCRAP